MLKEYATHLAPVLAVIFQASIDQAMIPSDWKKANVTPLFKKGDRANPGNYRPISLTCIACKVLEHIISSQMMDHFEKYNVLSDAQHGFRPRRSCESQLIITIHDIAIALDKGGQTDVILLDFQKAFDKVPHRRLLEKLCHYGIQGPLNNWICTFLSNRSQAVIIEGAKSGEVEVTSGVPQGSVLGPILFSIFINDLPTRVHSKVRLFADDCILYRQVKDQTDTSALQRDLQNLQEWCNEWLMDFHPEKCELLRITNKRNPINSTYQIKNHSLDMVDSKKYLGIHLHKKLSWNTHTQKVCSKANSTLGLLRRNMGNCPYDVKAACYTTLVRPQLEYGSTVWDPHTSKNIKALEMVQRRSARFICNDYRKGNSPSEMMSRLGWETLAERRRKAKAIMMFKINNSLIDIPRTLFKPTTSHGCRSNACFEVPFCRTNSFMNSFVPSAIRIWNGLAPHIRSEKSIESLKRELNKEQII